MTTMQIAFRTDASLQIGTGHVMRCLTLADALTKRGAYCHFICREHPGNLIGLIRSKGHVVHPLPPSAAGAGSLAGEQTATLPKLAHSHLLGTNQTEDAEACATILADLHPDWLIVDHYALDASWERMLTPHYRKLMVIDDLADRLHVCDLLLDQTFRRTPEEYRTAVPADCRLLCGSQYALLRPEFAALRPYSLQRRSQPVLRHLLITMGGVDNDNTTGRVLLALRTCPLPADCRITAVMGVTAPWLDDVRRQAQDMPCPTTVLVGVSDMAQLMADSDLAIGAAGTTAWERCCLGLPALTAIIAENQRTGAIALYNANATRIFCIADDLHETIGEHLLEAMSPVALSRMSSAAREITTGAGTSLITEELLNANEYNPPGTPDGKG
ncbi:UDP-2,4-diacetamido-2,4,6-trideoxy-beta-L-altropyranose hydrolase [Thauera linaloolentis]|uniref:Spore coat polysaccharide biosynthesis protein, glycosyltransferase n=1 Tax=Thauera linaloolentis (strain DSM 12138 / JCM 21573 / CCUG 41526 / CIP 105981 / IAM 15112 / NBRC 102519 / 47Lol) TaxID=1123367 RepID=N6ZCM7_THAL4|nr:UDP-2,4-diacetamido-2,4,6-trideoxy-beta-L-altropyranose hydrolase [Thauera linaloolentis]ENO89904.1 spore coat polysaccharide biosynthesis protein, glycosyltransferase [Thauera linaloolentis 47Lol = DSM 12138]MCM8564546.1 UDP-2,4-diacetamido-2,4,6-trideoxy-beta-L-altropyranose hydrolase [Thauera linaloolentis]